MIRSFSDSIFNDKIRLDEADKKKTKQSIEQYIRIL